MITVKVCRDKSGNLKGFVATGHAGYAPRGEDIVCSAVSTLTQTAVLGLESIGAPFDLDVRDGGMRVMLGGLEGVPPRKVEDARLILETIILGLKAVADVGREFVRVVESSCERGYES